jgi:uncharacterized protein (TIRG00374 family)
MSQLPALRRAAVRFARSLRVIVASPRRRWLIGGLLLASLAFAMLGRDDVARTGRAFAGADWRWAVAAVALMLVSLALRSLALQLIVSALGSVRARFVEAFSATSIGLLANAVAPVRAGTVLSPYVLYVLVRRRQAHLPFATAVGDTLTERMFAIVSFLVMALLCLGGLDAPAWARSVLLASAGLIAVPVVGGIVLNRRREHVARACARGGERMRKVARWLPQLVDSQRIWSQPAAALGVTGAQALAWVMQLAAAVAMLEAFHLGAAGLRAAVLVVVLTNLIGLVPATPGNVGTFQVAAVAALAAYGVGAGPALAYALGLQALQLAVAIVAGLAALAGHGLTLTELAGRSKQAAAALRSAEEALAPVAVLPAPEPDA